MAAARPFVPEHNIYVNLDVNEVGGERVQQMKAFLARSRVSFAVSENPALNLAVLTDFWTDIVYDESVNPPVIRATVNNRPVVFSRETVREVLQLGDAAQENGPQVFPTRFIWGAARRIGYSGPSRGQQLVKSFLMGQWRFLFHVIVKVFANKKSGFDDASPELMSMLLSLVYNKPYTFSGYIFDSFVGQVTRQTRSAPFLIYPRFTMLLIRHSIPDLAVQGNKTVARMTVRGYGSMWLHSVKKQEIPRPPDVDLFGAVVDAAYVPLPNHGWMDTVEAQAAAEAAGDQEDLPEQPQQPQLQQPQQLQQQPQPQQQQPQQQPQQAPQPAADTQVLINEVLNQESIPEVREVLLHEVLVRNDDENDPDLQEIEGFKV